MIHSLINHENCDQPLFDSHESVYCIETLCYAHWTIISALGKLARIYQKWAKNNILYFIGITDSIATE